MQDMAVNLDDLIKLKQKEDLEDTKSPWGITKRKVGDLFNTFTSFFGKHAKETLDSIEEFDRGVAKEQA